MSERKKFEVSEWGGGYSFSTDDCPCGSAAVATFLVGDDGALAMMEQHVAGCEHDELPADALTWAASEVARLTSALAEAEKERDEAQRAKYGTPCKCEGWIEEANRMEEERDKALAAFTAQGERLKAAHNEGKLAAYRQALALNEAPYLTRGETLRKMIAELRAAAQDQRGGGDNG